MIRFKYLIALFSCLFSILETASPQDLLNYSNSLKYADYLYESHQYDLASVEFERVVYLEPTDTLAKLKLIRSYRYLNDYTTAISRLEDFFPKNLVDLPEDLSEEYVKLLLNTHLYQKAINHLHQSKYLRTSKKREYEFGILTLQHRWQEAEQFAGNQTGPVSKSENFQMLQEITTEGLNTSYKSPAVATSLSCLVPGAGKIYTGKWKDAIYSFLFVSVTSWLTGRSYINNGIDINTVLLGTVTLGLYSANIYGSYKSAVKSNHKKNQSFTRQAENVLLNDQRIYPY